MQCMTIIVVLGAVVSYEYRVRTSLLQTHARFGRKLETGATAVRTTERCCFVAALQRHRRFRVSGTSSALSVVCCVRVPWVRRTLGTTTGNTYQAQRIYHTWYTRYDMFQQCLVLSGCIIPAHSSGAWYVSYLCLACIIPINRFDTSRSNTFLLPRVAARLRRGGRVGSYVVRSAWSPTIRASC